MTKAQEFGRGPPAHLRPLCSNSILPAVAAGAGPGLPISRWIAELHGGRGDAGRKLARGSRFVVDMPCIKAVERLAPWYIELIARAGRRRSPGRRQILVWTPERPNDQSDPSRRVSLGVPIIEKMISADHCLRVLIAGLSLAESANLAQLNPFDLVVPLTLSTVQNAIIGDDNPVTGGLIGAATCWR